jgi:hypothetical protein
MYCPRCAAQNLDDAKFCRGCGTSLEVVALALSGRYPPVTQDEDEENRPKTWQKKRQEALSQLIRATGLLGSSLLIGAALGLFSNQNDWIIIWMVFCGWMATWGVFSLVSGINSLMEARFMRQQLEEGAQDFPRTRERELITAELAESRVIAPRSVTEHTTKSLSERRPDSTKN